MGGKSSRQKQLERQQDQVTNQLLQTSQQQLQQGQRELDERRSLRQPFIDQQRQIATGDINAIRTAASPAFGAIERQAQADQAVARDTLTGASRDFAVAETQRNRNSQLYNFVRQTYLQAPSNLAALGAENAGVGQGLLSGGANAAISGSNIAGNQQQLEAQRRAQNLGIFSNLFRFAGAAAGGM